MFVAEVVQRRLADESNVIIYQLHTSAAAFGNKESLTFIRNMLQERHQAISKAAKEKVVETPNAAGANLLNQLRKFVPVRRRHGRISG